MTMCHKLGLLAIFLILSALSVHAQDENLPSWCPVDEPLVLKSALDHPYVELIPGGFTVYSVSDGMMHNETYGFSDVDEVLPSSDGEYISMLRTDDSRNTELWIVDRTNLERRLIVSAEDIAELRTGNQGDQPDAYGILNWAWVPGTRNLVFNTRVFDFGHGVVEAIPDDLSMVNAVTGEITPLLERWEGGKFTVSPDGRYIAVETHDTLLVYDLELHETHPVALDNYRTIGIGPQLNHPPLRWRQDGSAFLIALSTVDDPLLNQSNGRVEIYEINPTTRTAELIASQNAYYMVFEFAPDATHVAYWSTDNNGSNLRTLFIADVRGQQRLAIETGISLEFVAWSQNSAYFNYRVRANNHGWVVVMDDICGSLPNYPDVRTVE